MSSLTLKLLFDSDFAVHIGVDAAVIRVFSRLIKSKGGGCSVDNYPAFENTAVGVTDDGVGNEILISPNYHLAHGHLRLGRIKSMVFNNDSGLFIFHQLNKRGSLALINRGWRVVPGELAVRVERAKREDWANQSEDSRDGEVEAGWLVLAEESVQTAARLGWGQFRSGLAPVLR